MFQADLGEGDAQTSAEFPAELGILIGLRSPGAVMNMGGVESQPEIRLVEQVKQGRRVGAARECDHNGRAHQVGEFGSKMANKCLKLQGRTLTRRSRNQREKAGRLEIQEAGKQDGSADLGTRTVTTDSTKRRG